MISTVWFKIDEDQSFVILSDFGYGYGMDTVSIIKKLPFQWYSHSHYRSRKFVHGLITHSPTTLTDISKLSTPSSLHTVTVYLPASSSLA